MNSTLIGFFILVLSGTGAAQTDSPTRTEIEQVMKMYLDARNAQDAEGAAKHFADDYDQGNLPTGTIQIRSGQERLDAYREAFQAGRMRNTMEAETKSFRMLTDDVALLDAELNFTSPEGRQALSNFATFVFVKRDARWVIGAVRMSPLAETGSN